LLGYQGVPSAPNQALWASIASEDLLVIEKGEHVHVIYRTLCTNSIRHHILGEIQEAEDAVCHIEGYVC